MVLIIYCAELLIQVVHTLFASVNKGKYNWSHGPLSTLIKTILLKSHLEKLVNLTVSPACTLAMSIYYCHVILYTTLIPIGAMQTAH